MAHIVLVGDSNFDNARYTLGEPDVISQVRRLLPSGCDLVLGEKRARAACVVK